MRWLVALALLAPAPFASEPPGGRAAEIAQAIRESSFDRDECYRVRDLTLVKEDLRIYLNEGHLIFSKPVAGRRIAAVFAADVEGGDAEVLLLPPDRAERRSLASYTSSPNLNEHFKAALFLFTGDDYDRIKSQFPANPANKKAPEMAPMLDEEWTPVLRNLGTSYLTRLTLDLLASPGHPSGLFAALVSGSKLGNFDLSYDPDGSEQILAGQVATRDNRAYFDVWTSFTARTARSHPVLRRPDINLSDYRIDATVNPDLSLSVITKVKVRSNVEGATALAFDISSEMAVTGVTMNGQAAEVLQRESLRLNLTRGGNNLFLVVPPEPLHAGTDYEFEFRHSGKVIHDAGDRVFYVTSRGSWYPTHKMEFAQYDLQFRYPKDLDLVTPGDVVEDRTDDDWHITRRRTSVPIRIAAFNLGNYEHARFERAGYVVDVCANRALDRALQPHPQATVVPTPPPGLRNRHLGDTLPEAAAPPPPPDPLARLRTLAADVSAALEFMASKFGPPALPHLTVSPIPASFGQGFPGLIYLPTVSYLRTVPGNRPANEPTELFFQDVLQAHETAHQWWGNRVCVGSYRDYWLMEALANYTALLYVEKTKGPHAVDQMLDSYRNALIVKGDNGMTVDSTGPIVLGTRLESSQEPRAWRSITYGKGSWILQMLRRRLGDERFVSMLAEAVKRYDHKEISTDDFRMLAARYLPPKTDDPQLESFFDQWVYGTGIPVLKLSWVMKGKAPNLRLAGTLTQSDVDDDFTASVPVEVQLTRARTITQWVRTAATPVTFEVPVQQPPLKVSLDPRHGILRH